MLFTNDEIRQTIRCIEREIEMKDTHIGRMKRSRIQYRDKAFHEQLGTMEAEKKSLHDLAKKWHGMITDEVEGEHATISKKE